MNNVEKGFQPELKIRPSKEFADRLFDGVFDKNNLVELRHLLDKYDWKHFSSNQELRKKINNGLSELNKIKLEIESGYNKTTDLNEIESLILALQTTFCGRKYIQ
ncbi:MAG: hypothetical protein WC725_03385 [Patescibacteria group bacterium]|jgi:hypothetical protein